MSKKSPLSYVITLLSRTVPGIPDSISLAASFPEAGVSIAIAHLALSLGLVTSDSIREWMQQDSLSAIAESSVEVTARLTELRSLLNLIRAGNHLAADTIARIESRPPEDQLRLLNDELNLLPLSDEKRPLLFFYRTLKQIESQHTVGLDEMRRTLNMLDTDLRAAFTVHHKLLENALLSLSDHLESLAGQNRLQSLTYKEDISDLKTMLQSLLTASDELSIKHDEIVAAQLRLETLIKAEARSIADELVVQIAPKLSNVLAHLWFDVGIDDPWEEANRAISSPRIRNILRRSFEEIAERLATSLTPLFKPKEGVSVDQTVDKPKLIATIRETLEKLQYPREAFLSEAPDATRLAAGSGLSTMDDVLPATRKVVSEILHDLAKVASQIPDRRMITLEELVSSNSALLQQALITLSEISKIRETSAATSKRNDDALIDTEYRRRVLRRHDNIDLIGVNVRERSSRRYRLSLAYVSLGLSNDDNRMSTVPEALTDHSRLLLRGQAGSGKTTLLQWLAVQSSAAAFTEEDLEDLNNKIPILVQLRHFSRPDLLAPSSFPSVIAKAYDYPITAAWIYNKLEFGECAILIDGADEVPMQTRELVREWIMELVDSFPECRFVVTSRPSAVDADWLDEVEFASADILPLTSSGIEGLVNQWHEAVADQFSDIESKTDVMRRVQPLLRQIRSNKGLRAIATNPLLCAMLCALHREREHDIPTDRLQLYEECCRLLLEDRDRRRQIDLSDYPRLTLRQTKRLLEDLAYWLMDNDWTSVPKENAIARLDRQLGQMRRLAGNVSGDDVMRFLVDRTLLVREPIPGEIDFTHRTFQEFLAAHAASDQRNVGRLVQAAELDQWHETIALTAGIMGPEDREHLIRELLERGDKNEHLRHKMYLLAMSCLETCVDVSSTLDDRIRSSVNRVLPPRNTEDAIQIAAAGDLVLPYLKFDEKRGTRVNAACIRALGRIGGKSAVALLKDYAVNPGQRELFELVEACANNGKEFDGLLKNVGEVTISRPSMLKDVLDLVVPWKVVLEHSEGILDVVYLLKETRHLELHRCGWIRSLVGFRQISYRLESLTLRNCASLSNFDSFLIFESLRSIDLQGCSQLEQLHSFLDMKNLTSLKLSGCSALRDLSPLVHGKRLTEIQIEGVPRDAIVPDILLRLSHVKISYARNRRSGQK